MCAMLHKRGLTDKKEGGWRGGESQKEGERERQRRGEGEKGRRGEGEKGRRGEGRGESQRTSPPRL